MAAQGIGAPGQHINEDVNAAAVGLAAPAVGNAAAAITGIGPAAVMVPLPPVAIVPPALVVGPAIVNLAVGPVLAQYDIEAGLLGSPPRKSNIGCEIHAHID